MQELFTKLIRQSASDWERRFHPDFYESVYRLFGWSYSPSRPKPYIVGKITLEWVYEPVFPPEILIEIKEREVQEAAATMEIAVGHLKRYQPPASDRPSGAARKRLRWSEQAARSKDWRRLRLLGQDPTPPKAGIPRGRQGVKRG